MKYCRLFLFFLSIISIYSFSINNASALTEEEIRNQEAKWRAELAATEEEIKKWEEVLSTSKKGTASLERDASVLQAKINEAKAFIRQRNIQIEQLTNDINLKTQTISQLEEKIGRSKQSLASILREKNVLDSYSLVEVMLSNKNISDFFIDTDSYSNINQSMEDMFAEIRELQAKTDSERQALSSKRTQEADTKAKIETEKKKVEIDEAEKQRLIKINKTQEKTYEQVIKEKEAKAAAIRAALFSLRDSQAIPFGDALVYAQNAQAKTGVRPALILAILMQESDLGKNQGSCLVTDIETGDGAGKNTGTPFEKVMKAPRDTVPFKDITERLGKDYKSTPVSCPPGAKWTASRGYGGGMGPSQFIPSTWELFKNRIGGLVGTSENEANPWNAGHAIMATAVYMADLGAAGGGYSAERNAACRYYSGAACTPGRKPANVFYGDQVMAKAEDIQLTMIDPLEGF